MKKAEQLHRLLERRELDAAHSSAADPDSQAMLSIVDRLRELDRPVPSIGSQERCLSALRATNRRRMRFPFPATHRALRVAWTTMTLLLITAVGWGAVGLSKRSLPGDALYPVKRISERAYLAVWCNQQSRPAQRLRFADERLEETVVLAGDGRISKRVLRDMVAQCELAKREFESFGGDTEEALQPVIFTCKKQEAMLRALLPHAADKDTALLYSTIQVCSLMHAECHMKCDSATRCGGRCGHHPTE